MTSATTAKDPDASRASMTELVLPVHANALGNVFGGQILAWIDICAAVWAQRHCGAVAVTAGVDELAFVNPIKVGQVVRLEARLTAAFRTSVEVEVKVDGEDALTGRVWPCVRAFMTFVAVDADGKTVAVPALQVTSVAARERQAEARARRQARLARRG